MRGKVWQCQFMVMFDGGVSVHVPSWSFFHCEGEGKSDKNRVDQQRKMRVSLKQEHP